MSVSTAFLSSPKLSILLCFYDLLETQRTCFLFLLENNGMKKGKKKIVNFDNQNVNSLCSCHHNVNSS